MGLTIEYIDGQTPLDDDEKEGLLIKSITTRRDLDEFEQNNIESAITWILSRKFKKENILTEGFVRELHYKMFGKVWAWAGKFRKTNKNIGVEAQFIGTSLKQLTDNCSFWIENGTYPEEEIAIQFKHKLVKLHCFPNGNGRHSRLIADVLVSNVFDKPIFTWGGGVDLSKEGDARSNYLTAIREADKGIISPLIVFART